MRGYQAVCDFRVLNLIGAGIEEIRQLASEDGDAVVGHDHVAVWREAQD